MNDYTVPIHVEPLHEGVKRFPSGLKCCTVLILENCTDNEFASKQRKMYADASDIFDMWPLYWLNHGKPEGKMLQ